VNKTLEMRQKRATLVAEGRSILDLAEKENRDLTADENTKYEAIMVDVDKQGKAIDREEKQQAIEAQLQQSQGLLADKPAPGAGGGAQAKGNPEIKAAFDRFLRRGMNALTPVEIKALAADSDPSGGYLVAPQEFVAELIKFVDNMVIIRGLATVHPLTKSDSLGVPTMESDVDDADWTSELDTGSDDAGLTFGKRELRPHPLAKRAKISNKLLRVSALDVEGIVISRLGYKFAVTQEKHFMVGDGAEKPLGIFTVSTDGISAARDVVTGDNTAVTADSLIDTKYSIKQPYWRALKWIFHRDILKIIRKLKDGDGQYLWQVGITGGQPDTILDCPVLMSEYAPNTVGAGNYAGIIGDFSKYWIADSLEMQVQRLIELYAEKNQTGFIGRLETDGMPVLEEAFARVKLGS
jgi:HK97 family phage major capsid protein